VSEALQTLAYPLQHPGTKMLSAVAVQSTGQGLGKTLVGKTIGLLYGEHNTTTIGSADLTGNFNDWALDKQFVVGDEIATKEDNKRDAYNNRKTLLPGAQFM
jgi:putative DNA primase/helicase